MQKHTADKAVCGWVGETLGPEAHGDLTLGFP